MKCIYNPKKEAWLLYSLFFLTTLGRNIEPFAIVGWMLIKNQLSNTFFAIGKLFPFFSYLILSSLLGFMITQFPLDMFMEQIAQLVVYMSIYYAMMLYYKGNYDYVFKIYCKFAVFLSICAIAQYLCNRFIGIEIFEFLQLRETVFGDYARARAWMGEASYFAFYITPAIVYNSMSKGIENKKSLIMIGAGLLSFSPVFKLILGLFLLYYVIFAKLGVKKIILYGVAFLLINYVNNNYTISKYEADEIKQSETLEYWGASFSELETANLSTYALLKNLKIATMADNRITGTGIGSHGYSHDKLYKSNFEYSFLSKNDAFSLGSRIFSEMGIAGLIVFFTFFLRGFNKNNYINVSIVFYILYAFIRGGHYTIFGLQFFIMMFYFTSKYKINNYGIVNRNPGAKWGTLYSQKH